MMTSILLGVFSGAALGIATSVLELGRTKALIFVISMTFFAYLVKAI